MDWDRIIVHQYDPEATDVAGGINTCLRDMLEAWTLEERILMCGVSSERTPQHFAKLKTASGAEYDFISLARLSPGTRSRIPHTVSLVFGLLRLILRHPSVLRHDGVWQVHRPETALVVRLLSSNLVQCLHTNIMEDVGDSSDSHWVRMAGLKKRIDLLAAKWSRCVVVFNIHTAEYLSSKGVARVYRSTTWFDPRIFNPSAQAPDSGRCSDDLPVLWVGRFESPKNPLLALEVATVLRRPFIFIGQGTLLPEMLEAVDRMNMHHVEIRQPTDATGVAQMMRSAHCLLMTSKYEGSPRVLLEALGCGLPVVATPESDPDGILAEVSQPALWASSAAALAEAIESVGSAHEHGVLTVAADYSIDSVLVRIREVMAQA